MLKKVASILLVLYLLIGVNLPVKASVVSNNIKSEPITSTYSLLAQPFYVALYSDALNTDIYSRNQVGTISQDYFPLTIETYQKGIGSINEVKVDGSDITQVYSESDFYSIGENKAVFFIAGTEAADSNSSSWYNYVAVSTLSKGAHTIQLYCTVNGTKYFDSIRVIVA
ncbi:hypothetical protein NNC19_18670 [Clostridium sp. SHJSY1]|uniref:hypothetical protein n=1 Tax=Clostridium sp. SHJSY1 TaxID=2942483 RepID=UPI00287598C6|nr:hypothetical protein [Clostridium sp. SHJSY1]MDS0527717.1 hypothetical protein [Clostridium sp. SHJSY1]